MKVSELIAALANFPPDANVICQSDAEGNWHSPLEGVGEGNYRAENTWSGYIVDEEDEEYDVSSDDEYNDEEIRQPTERVVILFPVN